MGGAKISPEGIILSSLRYAGRDCLRGKKREAEILGANVCVIGAQQTELRWWNGLRPKHNQKGDSGENRRPESWFPKAMHGSCRIRKSTAARE